MANTVVSKNFTSEGVSATLVARRGQDVNLAVSGTYVATIVVERALSGDESAWEPVAGPFVKTNETFFADYTVRREEERLRSRLIRYTSGTVSATITAVDGAAKTADYVLAASDTGNVLPFNRSTAAVVTAPAGLPVGFSVDIVQVGAGQVSVVGGPGVQVWNARFRNRTAGRGARLRLIAVASDVFALTGDTVSDAYVGHLTTGCCVADAISTANKQTMVRKKVTARTDITSLQVLFPNFYVLQSAAHPETAVGASSSITASVEYPSGTFTQIKFGGATSGTIPDGGSLLSDAVTIALPAGTDFWIRMWMSNSVGTAFAGSPVTDTAGGDMMQGGTTVPDVTMGGTISNGFPGNTTPIAAIVGPTQVPSIYLLGDSKCKGTTDTSGSPGDYGQLARSVGPYLPYINGAVGGDNASFWVASHTNRMLAVNYCSHIVSEMGGNDISVGHTKAQVQADLTTIRNYWPAKTFIQCTLQPRTTSTDSFTTLANQTAAANYSTSGSGAREGFNDDLRANPSVIGAAGYFEMADVVESSRNSGKWKVDGTANKWTADGTHESPYAFQQEAASGAVDVTRLVR